MTVVVKTSDLVVDGDYRVNFGVSGAPQMTKNYPPTPFRPHHVFLRYSIDDTDLRWRCSEICVVGLNIRKDGTIGKNTLSRIILLFNDPELPPWLSYLVDTHCPERHQYSNLNTMMDGGRVDG